MKTTCHFLSLLEQSKLSSKQTQKEKSLCTTSWLKATSTNTNQAVLTERKDKINELFLRNIKSRRLSKIYLKTIEKKP